MARRINRRFVPLYFDLNLGGALADAKARQFVLKARPDLGKAAVSTPPLLVMTPDGDVLGEIDNYASEETVLASLGEVLAKHADWNQPSDVEKKAATSGTPIERANLHFDLGQHEEARRLLEKESSPQAALLLARFCRLVGQWEALEKALATVKGSELANDVHVERAWLLRARKEFAAASKELKPVAKECNRFSEARYLAGLLQYHQGKKDAALATWMSAIENCSQDPWVYRADWAYTQLVAGDRTSFGTNGERHSPLGRIGYMGRRNPDLELK